MKRRRMTGSELNAHMDDQTIPLQQVRTVRRCQRQIKRLTGELNEIAKQIAVIWMQCPPTSATNTPLREAMVALDVMQLDGETVTGWLDDWVLARETKEQAHDQADVAPPDAW